MKTFLIALAWLLAGCHVYVLIGYVIVVLASLYRTLKGRNSASVWTELRVIFAWPWYWYLVWKDGAA